jgi:hypothetical protein
MELKEWLKDEDKFKDRLMSYPGTTEEMALNDIELYKERLETKQTLLEQHNNNNWYVEQLLERRGGYPRPPGWKHAFFIPDSFRPRGFLIAWLIIIPILIYFFK